MIPSISNLDESAVLAKKFVPHQLKYVNTAPTNQSIHTSSMPTLDSQIKKIHEYLRPIPTCRCTSKSKHIFEYPLVQMTPEIKFALLPEEDTKFRGTLKSVDNISSLSDYLETFYILLQLERHEILKLYERYSQYVS